ncbi:MAG: transglycosylase SLT domain-containing protein [Pseudomonadota bacterium]
MSLVGGADASASTLGGDPAQVCDRAARRAAQEVGVPFDVLRAITRTETGRTRGGAMQPWPWTVNMEGHGVWFDTEDQAQVYVYRHFREGARSFDVGCFQINYKWHGTAFSSIEEMFDPVKNARYAAQFLRKLHAELGGWDRAVGAYHSRTHAYAQRYLEKYQSVRVNLPEDRGEEIVSRNSLAGFPLLNAQSGGGTRGSLVPLGGTGVGSLLAPANGG